MNTLWVANEMGMRWWDKIASVPSTLYTYTHRILLTEYKTTQYSSAQFFLPFIFRLCKTTKITTTTNWHLGFYAINQAPHFSLPLTHFAIVVVLHLLHLNFNSVRSLSIYISYSISICGTHSPSFHFYHPQSFFFYFLFLLEISLAQTVSSWCFVY